jgi:energy-coupling factor transport system permease protein
MSTRRQPRLLHPAAWWGWAIGVALAASRTTNPLLLTLLTVVVAYVVSVRRQQSPWSRSFGVFLRIGLIAVAVRVLLFAVLAPASGAHVLFRLPEMPLPHWLSGLRLGGPIAAEGLLASTYDGMRLAVILLCVGAANSLTSPRRLLKSLPAALYEAGVALTVATAFIPQAVATFGRIRDARRLRGRRASGPAAIRSISLAVLEGALERSVDLAAAMDARGFGRRGDTPARARHVTSGLTLTGLVLVLSSTYGLVDAAAPTAAGVPLLLAGVACAAAGLVVGHRRGSRTTYRPDSWRGAEWLVLGCGIVTAAAFSVGVSDGAGSGLDPLSWPTLPGFAVVGIAVALLPAWVSPAVPALRSSRRRESRAPAGFARTAM